MLDNQTLHLETVRLANDERIITQKLLVNLREIEKRRLYLDHGAGSLHEYCTKVLKYSEGSAGRRVNASRLIDAVPDIAEKIVDGSVNLSNLSMAQSFIRAEEKRTKVRMTDEEKEEVVSKVEDVSQHEAARSLAEMMPDAKPLTAKTRPIKNGGTELKFIVDQEFMDEYERVAELNSHKDLNMPALFKFLMQDHLNRHAPERKKSKTQSYTAAESKPRERAYLPVETERQLHIRAGSQCEFVDSKGQRCTRRHHLQVDHIISLAMGGTNEISNYQLLCRPHNLRKG